MAARMVVLAYFDGRGSTAILDALAAGLFPPPIPVQVGTYGISRAFGNAVAEVPGAVYAPMFPIRESAFWTGRKVPPDEERLLPPRWRGPLPSLPALLAAPAATRLAWGTELGRRFRDALRRAPQARSWQFDEIVSQVAVDRAWRDVIRGILEGLGHGRPKLGDRLQPGVVWMARRAFPLASQPVGTELQRFWQAAEHATAHLAGEEYPEFVGDPRAAARALDAGRRALLAGGPVRRALGQRYIAGLSPGVEVRPGLGGNVAGLAPNAVHRWRQAYASERVADGVAGVAVFDFRGRNGTPETVRAVLRELAASL
jgi:hypothetical protein